MDSICLEEDQMNNLSKFMIRQQSLKFLKIQHLAGTLNYKNADNWSRACIVKEYPIKIPDKSLADFFNSLGRCAKVSLEVISLFNFQIDS